MSSILVCAPTGYFADDVRAACSVCATPIVHRPHVPVDAVLMCAGCAYAAVKDDQKRTEIRITADTLREVALYYATTRGTQ